jgi:hypothetical protein
MFSIYMLSQEDHYETATARKMDDMDIGHGGLGVRPDSMTVFEKKGWLVRCKDIHLPFFLKNYHTIRPDPKSTMAAVHFS